MREPFFPSQHANLCFGIVLKFTQRTASCIFTVPAELLQDARSLHGFLQSQPLVTEPTDYKCVVYLKPVLMLLRRHKRDCLNQY